MRCEPYFGHEHWAPWTRTCPRCGAPQWQGSWFATRAAMWPAGGYYYGPIRPTPEERYEARPISDEVLQDQVYDALQSDPRIPRDSKIAVEVRDGVAALTGTVSDKWVKYLVGGDALAVPGIVDVNNRLQISRPERTPASTQ